MLSKLTLIIFIISFTVYWLPKCIFVSSLEFLFPSIVARIPQKEKRIALTFDDVPYRHNSSKEILNLLNKYGMKGTFFVISGSVSDISLLVQAVKEGHQLANHGRTESAHIKKSHKEFVREIDECDQLIKSIYNEADVPLPEKMYYRPGSGWFNKRMLKYIEEKGYQLALGSVYPQDPLITSSELNYWYIRMHLEGGDVVITHDRKWTIPMLKKLLPWMQKGGWTSVPLSEL